MHSRPPNDMLLSSILKSFVAGAPSKVFPPLLPPHILLLYNGFLKLDSNCIFYLKKQGRFEDFPDLGLSERDKEKIRDRAGIMSRHFYPSRHSSISYSSFLCTHLHSFSLLLPSFILLYVDQSQGFAEEKLDSLMNALHIAKHPDERELGKLILYDLVQY